jgi:ferredoxin
MDKFLVKELTSGKQFKCAPDRHLLQGMEASTVGFELVRCIPVGCRGGGCGICKIQIVDGQYEARKMSAEQVTAIERKKNIVLACRVYPRSDLVVRA